MNSQPLWRRWLTRAAFVAVAAGVSAALVVPEDADARRLGGGKSFGRQSPNATRQATPPSNAQQQSQAAQQQTAQQPRNRWLGPLTGLAAGLGIAALLSHFGLVGPLANMIGSLLVIGLLVMAGLFIWRMLRGPRPAATNRQRMEPAYGYAAGSGAGGSPVSGTQLPLGGGAGRPGSVASMDYAPGATPAAQTAPWGVPADFDTAAFLRNAKVYFIRLQADWDSKNLDDVREFTTPEVFAEIKMQLEEDKGTQNRTDVVDLDAQLLGIEENDNLYVASVRFEGRIREDDNPTPEPFAEVWNLAKPMSGRGGWLLAGIQQLS